MRCQWCAKSRIDPGHAAATMCAQIRGLPFRAAREEILAFFDGYACLRDTLFLGTDGRGRPSGEGWLTFDTPEEALRCARERNRWV